MLSVFRAILWAYSGDSPDGQAASDEPQSRTDKARGVSPNEHTISPYTILTRLADFGKQKVFKRLVICSRVKKQKAECIIIDIALRVLNPLLRFDGLTAISQRRRAPWRVPDFFNNAKYLASYLYSYYRVY